MRILYLQMLATSETWNGIRDMFHLSNFNFFLLLSYRQYRLDGYIQTSILKILTKMWYVSISFELELLQIFAFTVGVFTFVQES